MKWFYQYIAFYHILRLGNMLARWHRKQWRLSLFRARLTQQRKLHYLCCIAEHWRRFEEDEKFEWKQESVRERNPWTLIERQCWLFDMHASTPIFRYLLTKRWISFLLFNKQKSISLSGIWVSFTTPTCFSWNILCTFNIKILLNITIL